MKTTIHDLFPISRDSPVSLISDKIGIYFEHPENDVFWTLSSA